MSTPTPHFANERYTYYTYYIYYMSAHSVSLVHKTDDGENLIGYMARVSNPANQEKKSSKLISYLIHHKHWSPFEMVNMCVEINTTRSIAAQLLRHRSFSFQEFSQRYSDVTDLGSPILPELRRQDYTNRQNSIDDINHHDQQVWLEMINDHQRNGMKLYHQMLKAGIAKECAREVLPMSSPSRLYMNGTLRSWIHYCQLRCDPGTQKEHRTIALQIRKLIKQEFPLVYEALNFDRNF